MDFFQNLGHIGNIMIAVAVCYLIFRVTAADSDKGTYANENDHPTRRHEFIQRCKALKKDETITCFHNGDERYLMRELNPSYGMCWVVLVSNVKIEKKKWVATYRNMYHDIG